MSEEIKKTEDTDTEMEATEVKETNYHFNKSLKGQEFKNISSDKHKKTTVLFHGFSSDFMYGEKAHKYQADSIIALPNRKAFGDTENPITIYIDWGGSFPADILSAASNEVKTRGTQGKLSDAQRAQVKKGYIVIVARDFFEEKKTSKTRGARPKFEDLSNADKAEKIKSSGLTKAELLEMINSME